MITDEQETELIERARQNLPNAYAPYSKYKVGVALLGEKGIYDGVNVEMVIHRATHGERMAIDNGVFAGERRFLAVAVVTDDPNNPYPCGQCRQDLAEFDDGTGFLEIIAANLQGDIKRTTLDKLLPDRFGPFNLGIDITQY